MKFILTASFLLFAITLNTHAQSLPSSVTDALKKENIPLEAISAYVQEVPASGQSSNPLITWQANEPFQPASTMKVLTSYAALSILGPAYTWKTSAYITGHKDGDALHGDLFLQGGGDPKLVLENFWMFIQQIRAKGIRTLHGKLVLDASWIEPKHFDAADFDGDPTRPYNVGPEGLLVNYNALTLQVQPNKTGLQVFSMTPMALHIASDVKLDDSACNDWRQSLQPRFSMVDQTIHMTISGTYAKGCGEQTWYVTPYPLTHTEYIGALFRELWKQSGGQFEGSVEQGNVPSNAELITVLPSQPLPEVLYSMNKYSNNVMTRLVLLTLDKEVNQRAANADRAMQLVLDWLTRIKVDTKGLVIENGSGLSRTERISAYQMAGLLNHAFASPVMPELMYSLPILGVDGTMQKRAANHSVMGHAHIKSGRLKDVRAIAGYVLAVSGKRYVIASFVNHPNSDQASAALDELLQWVYING